MRLPGTRYQEHGWEHVRKLLGHCSLRAYADCDPALLLERAREGEMLSLYVDRVAQTLHACGQSARAEASGNSYGESVFELALSLLYELRARPADWAAFCSAVRNEHEKIGPFWLGPARDAILRKKVNDMYAGVRDKVDSDNYQVACGRSCSPNKIYAYRMLDTAYGEIARIFAAWRGHPAQVAAILGRAVEAVPIEVHQLRTIGDCKAEWVIRWSATLEQFGNGAGPLHTRSKRFASLKNSPEKIGEMLREIGDYEELSSNRDRDWLLDADGAADWMDDLWRVLDEPEGNVSPSPRLTGMTTARQVLAGESLPVRLAVYLTLMGAADDSYPDEWLDPATGELPTMQRLAQMAEVSLPTLRKRRDSAIDRLLKAAAS